ILFILTTLTFLVTALSDPGVVPPLEVCAFASIPSFYQIVSYALYVNTVLDLDTARDFSTGHDVRFCTTCKIYRLEGWSHCSECGYCIRGFDHHCAVVNNCIGLRNRRAFV
ncbi:zinc finger protein DHHC domain containing protein, putative, partial [Perkinsus marinus ATCC 50983]